MRTCRRRLLEPSHPEQFDAADGDTTWPHPACWPERKIHRRRVSRGWLVFRAHGKRTLRTALRVAPYVQSDAYSPPLSSEYCRMQHNNDLFGAAVRVIFKQKPNIWLEDLVQKVSGITLVLPVSTKNDAIPTF